MEEILLDDKDEDGDASSTNESEEEEEVVEVGREKVKEVKKPPGKLAPIFMLGKPPKVQQATIILTPTCVSNAQYHANQCCGSMKFWYGSGSADSYL
jgi:hypothetical protein